jgi:hypothetical protein
MLSFSATIAVEAQQPGASGSISLSGGSKGASGSANAAATPPSPTAPAVETNAPAPTGAASETAPPAPGAAPAAEPAPVTTPPVAAPTAAPSPAASDTEMDPGTYSVRLRDLEQNVNELKEQIFRSKARLSLLAETVLQGVVAGAQAHIVHENRMGSSYKLVKVMYALDGAPILNKSDEEGGLGEKPSFDIYNGSIVPGEHTLTVQLEYRGHGYGIFSYLRGYRFKVSSSHAFTAVEGKATTLHVIGYEKGGPTAPLEERPAVRYLERVDAPSGPVGVAGAGGK